MIGTTVKAGDVVYDVRREGPFRVHAVRMGEFVRFGSRDPGVVVCRDVVGCPRRSGYPVRITNAFSDHAAACREAAERNIAEADKLRARADVFALHAAALQSHAARAR